MLDTIKKIVIKYFSQLLMLLTIVGLGYFGYTIWKNNKNLKGRYANLINTQTKYNQLTKYTAQLESKYKKQQELFKSTKQKWSEVKTQKDEKIKLLSDITYTIGKNVSKQHGPDYYFETPKHTQNFVLNELRIAGKDSPPIGYILIKSNGKIYKRNYRYSIVVHNLQTIDEKTGKIKVYSKAFFIAKESGLAQKRRKDLKNWKNIGYPLPIVGGSTLVDPVEASSLHKHFIWWAPHLNGGVSLTLGSDGLSLRPSLDLSIAGYGTTRNDLDWKIVHLGLDSDTYLINPGIHLMPFSYRFWPSFLTNTYIGPSVGFTLHQINYQLNLNLSF